MARFIGSVQGSKGEVSRLGGAANGIRASAQGWNVGVRVDGRDQDGDDVFYIYATGGSNGRSIDFPVAVVSLDKSGKVVVERTAEEREVRKAREAREAEAKPDSKLKAAKAAKPESFEVSPGRVNRGGCY